MTKASDQRNARRAVRREMYSLGLTEADVKEKMHNAIGELLVNARLLGAQAILISRDSEDEPAQISMVVGVDETAVVDMLTQASLSLSSDEQQERFMQDASEAV